MKNASQQKWEAAASIPPLIALGANIRKWRKIHGLSQRRLAELSGTTQTTIAMIEAGKANPTFKTIQDIAKAMKLEAQIRFR